MRKMTAYAFQNPNLAAVVLHEKEFVQFRDLIYRIAGISMSPAKKALVTSRLAKRLPHSLSFPRAAWECSQGALRRES
jgi:chemotaxis protein methyltransferase CheR